MNKGYIATLSALAMHAFIIVMMLGCASGGINLIREGTVKIDDQVSSNDVHLNHVVVEQQSKNIIFSGDLHRKPHQRKVIVGNIHVEIIAPDGKTLKRVNTGLHRLSRKSYQARFSTKLPIKLPSGSTVRIIFDRTFDADNP